MSDSFIHSLEKHFEELSQTLFSDLKSGEELNLNLNAEESTFLRFNRAQVRQNTSVNQKILSLQFQAHQRKSSFECTLSGNLEQDRALTRALVQRAREETEVLAEDPFIVPMENRGESRRHHVGQLLSADAAIENIVAGSKGNDFVGFYAAGPVVRSSRNSKGQKHWFSTESFFIDYSLFTKNVDGDNKAVKGVYADTSWDQKKFSQGLQTSLHQLSLTQRKSQVIKPGAYRTYLAPGAMAELCQMLYWNALSFSALKKGNCAFAKLYDKQKSLSPLSI